MELWPGAGEGAGTLTDAAPGIDTARLKAAFGSFATGMTVVTARLDGSLHGMTANAFSAVSLDPPLVLVCVDKSARMHEFIGRSGAFAVNILSSDQEDLARHFARGGRPLEGEFALVPYTVGRTGCPILSGVAAYVECTLHHAWDGGDHTIYVGVVQATNACPECQPLLHWRRQYLVWTREGMPSGNMA
jgi:flavin reductase (DIM6/NTAB) family NADH-FMN oxidoreductase RutF